MIRYEEHISPFITRVKDRTLSAWTRLDHWRVAQLRHVDSGATLLARPGLHAQGVAPFIVGMGRSGTTLLRLMLDAHSRLAIPPETNFLDQLLRRTIDGKISPRAAVNVLKRSANWSSFHIGTDALLEHIQDRPLVELGDVLRGFYESYAQRLGKEMWGDKTPDYVLRMEVLDRILPEARFIHIIRDCRDVVASMRLAWFSPTRQPDKIARAWVERVQQGRQQGGRVRHYLELRYEDLITHTEKELGRICTFLGLEFEPAMLEYHRSAPQRMSEIEAMYGRFGRLWATGDQRRHFHRNTAQPPLSDRIGRWRRDLNCDEILAVETAASPLMQELGYISRD